MADGAAMGILSAPHRGSAHRGQLAFLAVLAAVTVWLPGCGAGSSGITVQGSGVAATQTRTVARFSRLDLAGSSKVTVVVGGRQSVVVHADSNLLGRVTTRVAGGTLLIGTTGSFTTRTPMSVDITVPVLAAVTLSGSGQLSVTGISTPVLTVSLPGSGSLDASGTTTRLDVTLDGSGQAQLRELTARDVHAVIAGSGLILVTATASLDASVPGSGAIVYGGNPPRVTSSVTGSGAVTHG
jgi:Putative auto-transporter adhesin, head GIN domain